MTLGASSNGTFNAVMLILLESGLFRGRCPGDNRKSTPCARRICHSSSIPLLLAKRRAANLVSSSAFLSAKLFRTLASAWVRLAAAASAAAAALAAALSRVRMLDAELRGVLEMLMDKRPGFRFGTVNVFGGKIIYEFFSFSTNIRRQKGEKVFYSYNMFYFLWLGNILCLLE
jgi:hypothetical protein